MTKDIKEGTRLKAAWRTAKEIGGPAVTIAGIGGIAGAALAGVHPAVGAASALAGVGLAAGGDIGPTYRRHKRDVEDERASGVKGTASDFLNRSGLAGKAKTQKLYKKLGIGEETEVTKETIREDEHYDRIIQATLNNKPVDVKDAFNDAVFGKIADRIDALSVEIAQNTFAGANTTPSEPEEDDDAFTDPEEFEDDAEWAEDEDDLSSVQDDEDE